MTCGVYKITNNVTNKHYIGSSNNVEGRLYTHFYRMHNGCHGNRHLQRAFDKYGKDSFTTEIMKECEQSELIHLEQEFIDTLQPQYNMSIIAGRVEFTQDVKDKMSIAQTGNQNFLGHHHTEESKRKMREAKLGNIASEESRRKMSEAHMGEKNHNFSVPMQAEQKLKLSVAMSGNTNALGRKLSDEGRASMSVARTGNGNPFAGRKHTDETRAKMSAAAKLRWEQKKGV